MESFQINFPSGMSLLDCFLLQNFPSQELLTYREKYFLWLRKHLWGKKCNLITKIWRYVQKCRLSFLKILLSYCTKKDVLQRTVFQSNIFYFDIRKLTVQKVTPIIFIYLSLKYAQWDQYFKQTFGEDNKISQTC